jgi:Mycobacterium membrane protein
VSTDEPYGQPEPYPQQPPQSVPDPQPQFFPPPGQPEQPPPSQPGYGQRPQQRYQPPQAGDFQGFYAQQPPQGPPQQPGWEQQPRRGRPAGPRATRRRRNARTGCLSVLGVIVLIIIIIIIVVATNHGNGNNSPASSSSSQPAAAANNPASSATSPSTQPPADPTTVTFSVTGSGNGGAEIQYGSSSDNISPSGCTIGDLGDSCSVPWSASLPFDGTAEYWDINAQLGSDGGSITCTITVSGPGDQPLTVASGQASGAYQICNAQAAPTSSSGLSWQQES